MRGLTIALAAALIAWLIAHLALDYYLVAQGTLDLGQVLRGNSRMGFEFDHPRDLISGGSDDARDIRVSAGVLRGRLPGEHANLRLNLRGLQLNAKRFHRLQVRIEVNAPSTLALIFDQPGRLDQLTRQVELEAGWNDLDIDLASSLWSPNAGGDPQRWGGDSGRVGEFRLYLAGPARMSFGVDHLRFREDRTPAADTTEAVEWIDATTARARLREGRPPGSTADAPLGVLLNVGGDTPERALALRDEVRRQDAEAVFWPNWRGAPAGSLASAHFAPIGWSPGWIGVGLYALAAIWVRWRRCKLTSAVARTELMLGFVPLLALSLGLGLAEQPATTTLAWIAAALAFQLSGTRLSGSTWAGSAEAWAISLRVSGFAASALLAVAVWCNHFQLPGIQRATLYVPFVLLQQLVLLGFLWPRAEAWAPRRGRLLAAALFALAHAPNFALMLLSLLAAWWWLALFERQRAWLPILASHYLLGLLAITCLPPDILYSAELGLRYFQVQ